MSTKGKRGSKENPITTDELEAVLQKPNGRLYKITSANLVDGYCNYGFEIIEGIGKGDSLTGKGSHVVKDDLRDAFAKMNVHLAVRDDIFKHSGTEVLDVEKMHGHEFTTLYNVTGFKMGGSDESESIVLIGNKYVSGGDRFSLTSPKIMIDDLSSYQWWNELKAASDVVREEVALYKEGKYIEEEEDQEEKEKLKQTKLSFGKGKLKVIIGDNSDADKSNDLEGDGLDNEIVNDDMSDFEKASL